MNYKKVLRCKRCGCEELIKSGVNTGVERYKCKGCNSYFIERYNRSRKELVMKRALSVILYSSGRASFGFLGKLFGVNRSTVYRWIKGESQRLSEDEIEEDIKNLEIDEMWHYVGEKKTKDGCLKPTIVIEEKLLYGYSVAVTLKPFNDSMTKSNI